MLFFGYKMSDADYIIVGAGSAGCVLANRLSANGSQVVILESGPKDNYPMVHLPAGALYLRGHPVIDWKFTTEASSDAGKRQFEWPRGRLLGGSSSLNGMNFVRGLPSDFDSWEEAGCKGWGFKDVLPYFKSMERYDGGSDELRGRNGPLRVENYRTILDLTHCFVEAAQQAGFAKFPDLNGATGEGVGYSQMSRNGRFRASSAQAFLKPAMSRPNLRVITEATVLELLFDGKRCTGLRYRQGGEEHTLQVRREMIVSAGAIGSPHLLQVSGVGDAEHLRSIGVTPKHDLPGVGRNLIDHYSAVVSQRVKDILTLNDIAGSWRLVPALFQWLALSKGPLTFGATTATVYVRSRPDLAHPDIQMLFIPAAFLPRTDKDGKQIGALAKEPGMRITVSAARPKSRGSVLAGSADVTVQPKINTGYLTSRADADTILSGIKIARRIFSMPALQPYIVGEHLPGASAQSDDDLNAYVRNTGNSVYHPCGTCRMGTDADAVVDARLKVHGLDNVRVVDASIMPSTPSGNINAPTTMIGEKGSAIILEDERRNA